MQITPAHLNTIAEVTIWIVNIIYSAALIPQVILNYKLKSTKGLSDFMILGYMSGYIAQIYYNFCIGLPAGYKVVAPFALASVLIMVFQRIYYHKKEPDLYFISFCMGWWVLSILAIPFAFKAPQMTGYICGWITTFIWSTYQIPQAYKIYKNKSVRGLSLPFTLLLGLGILIETISGFILHLPMPTIFNNLRSITAYILFIGLYFYYRAMDMKKVENTLNIKSDNKN